MACEPVAQGGDLVLAGRSDLASVSYLPVVDHNEKRKLTVYATASVKLYKLGGVVDRVAHVAVVIVGADPSSENLELDQSVETVVLHLNDANVPRVVVKYGVPLEPSKKGWQRKKHVMAARGPGLELLVVARVSHEFKGIQVCRHGTEVHVEPQVEPSGLALPISNDSGNLIGRIVSARIRLLTEEAVTLVFGGERLEIPTDQAPDNFVPDLRYGLRVLEPPQQ